MATLTYRCPTCDKEYEAHYSGDQLIYIEKNDNINKRHILKNDSDDCYSCHQEEKKYIEEKRAEIRAKKQQTA